MELQAEMPGSLRTWEGATIPAVMCLVVMLLAVMLLAWAPMPAAAREMVIVDTDIGDDVGDAFAVALALSSPELKVLGITSAFGDTALRARLLDRLVRDAGATGITVAAGIRRHRRGEAAFTQRRFATAEPARPHPDAVEFLLQEIRRHPGDVTVIAIAPLTNLGAAYERDPTTFGMLKRIVMMGGSVRRGYGAEDATRGAPDAEYNVAMDVAAARAVFNSEVPLDVMSLDATQQKLDAAGRRDVLTACTGFADDLGTLYREWAGATRRRTPVLYDLVAVAHAIDPTLCPALPMHLEIDGRGVTRSRPGPANSRVCLKADSARLLAFYLQQLTDGAPAGPCPVSKRGPK